MSRLLFAGQAIEQTFVSSLKNNTGTEGKGSVDVSMVSELQKECQVYIYHTTKRKNANQI